jgi:hypothetical protein
MHIRSRSARWVVTSAAALAGLAGLMTATTSIAQASSASNNAPAAAANGTVYQANVGCCQDIVLPAWPAAGPILTTKPIPPGSYSVVGNAFIVIGPSEDDNCWLTTSNASDTISGEGAAVGNGATESGTGPAGVYANAMLNYTVVVTATNDHLTLNCDSKHPGQGTYAASATLIATKVPSIVSR